MINMFIRIFVIFHHLNHVDWKRRGLCVVGSPPKRDRRGQGGRGGMNKGRDVAIVWTKLKIDWC